MVKHLTICRIKLYMGLLELTSPSKELACLSAIKPNPRPVSSNLGNGAFVSGIGRGRVAVFTAMSMGLPVIKTMHLPFLNAKLK